jgi:catalase
MRILLRPAILCATTLLLGVPARAEDPLAVRIVNEMNAIFGVHPGFRATHAKGAVYDGSFTPAPEASGLSRAPQFQAPLPLLVRFSDGTGMPMIPDGAPGARPQGMALRFVTPDGQPNDIVANALDDFPVGNGEDFVEFLHAVATSPPGTASPTPVERFLASHPAALRVAQTPKPAPRSFATQPYFGVNAFWLVGADGTRRAIHYAIEPVAGRDVLEATAAAAAPPNYLFAELDQRLAAGPAMFTLVAQMAAEGDPTNDATLRWPADRPRVVLGTISIRAHRADSDAQQRALAFDPTHVVDGVALSDDPLLPLRREAYGVSIARRQ